LIGLALLIAGAIAAVYGHLRMEGEGSVNSRADGALLAVAGYVLAFIGLCVVALT
jgi:hypothetical protein